MTEAEWLTCTDPELLFPFLRVGSGRAKLRGYLSKPACERKLRLFIVACCRRIWPLITHGSSRRAVEVAEGFADGLADEATLNAAHQDADAAYTVLRRTTDVVAYCAAGPPVEAARVFSQGGAAFHACAYAAAVACMAPAFIGRNDEDLPQYDREIVTREKKYQADLVRDLVGNPFRPLSIDVSWRSERLIECADAIYRDRAFDRMPSLAESLENTGCDRKDIVAHCHQSEPHARGCWLVDQIMLPPHHHDERPFDI